MVFCDFCLTRYNIFRAHPCCLIYQRFVPLYCGTIFHWLDRPCFIYPLISLWTFGLSLFHCLWTMLLWTLMYSFCEWGHMFLFLLSMYLRVELMDYIVTPCLTIWSTAWQVSNAAAPFDILTSVWHSHQQCREVLFLHLLTNTCYCVSFYYSHPSGCEVVSHHRFNLYFPSDWWRWASFHVLIGYLYVFFGEMSVQVLDPFSVSSSSFYYWAVIFFIYSGQRALTSFTIGTVLVRCFKWAKITITSI